MKQLKINFQSFTFLLIASIACIVFSLQSCKTDKKVKKEDAQVMDEKEVIDILTENMDFQMPDTITSGWNTFRYKNASPQTHFFLVDKYPEGKTSEDAENLVAPVFDRAMKLIREGKAEEGFAEFANLPEWFKDVKFMGGSGLLSPDEVAQTTFSLEPGNYIVECYVKMSNGVFHTSMGMTKDIVVSDKDSGNEPLKADVKISISSTEGIVVNDSIGAGQQTFSVTFKDQTVHEHFVGHDVNLAKLEKDADLEELEIWMNWAEPDGLTEPAPNGVTFLGGVNDMPTGSVGYFTAQLKPGKYALIAEVPNASQKKMLKTFTIAN